VIACYSEGIQLTDYSIERHQHVFAIWAASRAAARGIQGLTTALSSAMIDATGLPSFRSDDLPEPGSIDDHHEAWRHKALAKAKEEGFDYSHGVAAKLINVYCKSRFVCTGNHLHPKVAALHPPIDRILLQGLSKAKIKGFSKPEAWKTFDSDQYKAVIENIRTYLGNRPMWMIEEFFHLLPAAKDVEERA
jgi:hypothetical protein